MNQILSNTSKAEEKKKKIWIFALIAAVLVMVCISTVFALVNNNNDKILNNVYVDGINVSKMTKDEAYKELNHRIIEYKNRAVVLSVGAKEYSVLGEDLGFDSVNLEEVIEKAYQYGRDKSFIENNYTILFSNFIKKNIEIEYSLDTIEMEELVKKLAASNESIVLDDSYDISGDYLIIKKGQDGLKINDNDLNSLILSAIKNDVDVVDVPIKESMAQRVDFNQVYETVYIEPVDASIDSGEKFEVVVEKNGRDFDLEEAKRQYNAINESGEIEIPLRVLEPSVKIVDLEKDLFQDTLAISTSKYTSTMNSILEKLNETMIYPGEEFSFTKIVEGYGENNNILASALYEAALRANIEVIERKANSVLKDNVKAGLDAVVDEKSDLKVKNTRTYPVKIEATHDNNHCIITMKGMKEKNERATEIEVSTVETIKFETKTEKDASMYEGARKIVQTPVNGAVVEVNRIVKDANGNVLTITTISKDSYAAIDEIVKVGTKTKVTTPPITNPVVTPVPEIEEKPVRQIPQGWDSPESPYAN